MIREILNDYMVDHELVSFKVNEIKDVFLKKYYI